MPSDTIQDAPSTPSSSVCSEIRAEEVWREAGEHLAMSKISEKMVAEKEQQLRMYIRENYSRIKNVETELEKVQFELKMAAGPKQSALEMLRKKIEQENEVVMRARARHIAARRFLAATEEELIEAEGAKERLCAELNMLVQQSARMQLQKLDQLTDRLEMLSSTTGSSARSLSPDGDDGGARFNLSESRSAPCKLHPSLPLSY